MIRMALFASALALACSPGAASAFAPGDAVPAAAGQTDAASFDATAPTDLSEIRGGQDTNYGVISDQTLGATNSGNSVTAGVITTGQIGFSAHSLSGFNGVGNFVLNTGNNNNLQGAVNITIVIPPSS